MFPRLRYLGLFVVGFAGTALADDTVRLVGRPTDRSDISRLDIRPGDSNQDQTELTAYRYGGRYYGGYAYRGGVGYHGGYGHYHYGYRPYAYGYRSYAYYGHRPYSYGFGLSFGYYGPRYSYGYPYYSFNSYPFYSSYYYPSAYYSAPPVYYGSPYVIYTSVGSNTADDDVAIPNQSTFRYDGDRSTTPPVERIPPAKIDVPVLPELPAPPSVPKLGPSPTELKVSTPAPATKKKYSYPAYGEDRAPARDDKTLLIRRDQ